MYCFRQKIGTNRNKVKHLKTIRIFIASIFFFIPQILSANAEIVIPEVNLTHKKTNYFDTIEQKQTTTITQKDIIESPSTTLADLLEQEQSIVRVINNSSDNITAFCCINKVRYKIMLWCKMRFFQINHY